MIQIPLNREKWLPQEKDALQETLPELAALLSDERQKWCEGLKRPEKSIILTIERHIILLALIMNCDLEGIIPKKDWGEFTRKDAQFVHDKAQELLDSAS